MDHGKYASSLTQLNNELPVLPKFEFHFASDGTNWSVLVPQQEMFAGNYLLALGNIYFTSAGLPSTNDTVLWSRN